MAAKSRAEIAQEFAQNSLSTAPVIILGSGASAAHGVPGMWALAAHLSAAALPPGWTGEENAEWTSFLGRLKAGVDLETALQAVRPTERQTQFIAGATREFLLPFDLAVLESLLVDRHALPLTRLYRHVFDSTHTTIHVVTPNYDRLAEYAADAVGVSTFTGFNYGYLQTRARTPNTRVTVNGLPSRTVAIWKVHGSLDWFQDAANQIVGVRSALTIPASYAPLMITPGIDKYRLTHVEPFRTILSCSDKALETARSYFCVGYGFNDEHLQTKLIERCNRDSIPLVVITKELTTTAKAFLTGGRCRRYLAIEDGATGARAYMHDAPAGFDLDKPLWRLDQFLDHVTGTRP
ncbi:SIR2-like domain-containing protein [Bradyrhizobium sp. Rc2d]|uniref:SIR2 family protein n=1 Tax=Bradyrhizobium sp. Rc2d TaxID=1855321 RepID=UPI00087F65D8|nr:SIR2 family protein [Bradyrhizobium sp. Rc2d]SDH43971.1 SIR2-like domain-containing protein [Bradyrhizobium sp. Rc2d]